MESYCRKPVKKLHRMTKNEGNKKTHKKTYFLKWFISETRKTNFKASLEFSKKFKSWSLRKMKQEVKSWSEKMASDMEREPVNLGQIVLGTSERSSLMLVKHEADIDRLCLCGGEKVYEMRFRNAEKRKMNGNSEKEDDRHGGQDFTKEWQIFFRKNGAEGMIKDVSEKFSKLRRPHFIDEDG